LKLPDFFLQMLERKWLGDKTKGGFYRKNKKDGKTEIFALDWKTMEYRPVAAAEVSRRWRWRRRSTTCRSGCRMLLAPSKDKASIFLWSALSDLWTYAANRIGEISDSIVEIDRAMKLGFNWEMGPFELWDAAGVAKTVKRMQVEGKPVSPNVEKLLASGHEKWYADDPKAASGRAFFDVCSGNYHSEKFRQACGRSRSRRNPAWSSRRMRALRWSTLATASAASSSTPR
jgi:3-hydroxyacyl-CoA dehydrogenase